MESLRGEHPADKTWFGKCEDRSGPIGEILRKDCSSRHDLLISSARACRGRDSTFNSARFSMIPIEEIAVKLREVAQGQRPFRTLDWDSGYHWRIAVDGYDILIFDDAGECDYVEWAIAPDGTKTTYDEWFEAAQPLWPVHADVPTDDRGWLEGKLLFKPIDPVMLLSPDAYLALQTIMHRELYGRAKQQKK